jgi:AcrR family transcriptional regulator
MTGMFLAVPQPPTQRSRQPHQLPPGRHGLPREYVRGNQRQRILAAVAEAVSDVGYAAMTVEDIIKAAGVSRRTFYEHFKGKEDAFLVSYEDISAQLMQVVDAAFHRTDSFVTRVEDCMRAFLTLLAAEPAYANMCIVEVLVAGQTAIERRNAVMRQFTELIDQGAAEALPKNARPPALTSETLVGGVHEVIYARVLRGETAKLPELLPDLTFSVLLPYMGRDVATDRYRRLRRRKKPAG